MGNITTGFDAYVKPKDLTRTETISLPGSYWEWVEGCSKRNGSNRSQVIRALVDYVREHAPEYAM